MAITSKYFLTGQTYLDLGLNNGNLNLQGQEFQVVGSAGNNEFFLRPAGYTFDFTVDGGGTDKIYLTGTRANYTAAIASGVVTLTRGSGATAETIKFNATSTAATLVFADGAVVANKFVAGTGNVSEAIAAATKSTDVTAGTSTGSVRLVTELAGDNNVLGGRGLALTVIGNGGVDKVFVPAGSNVDATKLGAGKDIIYMQGNWADYTKSVAGLILTLTRTVTDLYTNTPRTETVKVVGGTGASNDQLVFADGAIDSSKALAAVRTSAGVATSGLGADWSNAIQTAGLTLANTTMALASDTGVNTDSKTSNGQINVDGLDAGTKWQYSTNNGTTWVDGTGSSFTLAGQKASLTTGAFAWTKGTVVNGDFVRLVLKVNGGSNTNVDVAVANATTGPTLDNIVAAINATAGLGATASKDASNTKLVLTSNSDAAGSAVEIVSVSSLDSAKTVARTGSIGISAQAADSNDGITYAANTVQVREIDPFGNALPVSKVANQIVVDKSAGVVDSVRVSDFTALRVSPVAFNTVNKATTAAIDATATGTNGKLTLGFWVKLDALPTGLTTIIGDSADAAPVDLNADGTLAVWSGGYGSTVPSVKLVAGQWQYVSYTADGTSYKVYIDGVLATSMTGGRTYAVSHELTLMNHHASSVRSVPGLVRDVAIWKTAHTATEVAADKAGPSLTDTNLLAYYPLSGADTANLVSGGPALSLSGAAAVGATATSSGTGATPLNYGGKDVAYSGNNPVVTGKGGEVGATVTVYAKIGAGADTAVGTGTVLADGSWSVTTTLAPPAKTDYVITAKQTDVAGNTSTVASNVASLQIDPSRPATPQFLNTPAGNDTGATGDFYTSNKAPKITGTLPASIVAGDTVQIMVDGASAGSVTATTATGAFQVDYTAKTWSYTPATNLTDGVHKFAVVAKGVSSNMISVTVDSTSTAPTLTTPAALPTLIENATFDGSGNWVLSGRLEDGSTAATLKWIDSVAGVGASALEGAGKAATITQNSDGTTTWSVTLTKTEMATLAEGNATFTVVGTDRAGNTATYTSTAMAVELVNSNPVSNSAQTIGAKSLQVSAAALTKIVDLNDLANNGSTTTNDVAFTDADAAGSSNATLSYSALLATAAGTDTLWGTADDVTAALPSWLELTSAGVLQVKAGQTAPASVGTYHVQVKATDGANATAIRDVQVDVAAAAVTVNTAKLAAVTNLDVRSDLLLEFTNAVTIGSTGKITLKVATDATKDGYGDFVGATNADIVLDMANATQKGYLTLAGDGKSVTINLPGDLNLDAKYELQVEANVFKDAVQTSMGNAAVTGVFFSTVSPTAAGQLAKTLSSGAYADSDTWYDGYNSGSVATNTAGLSKDLGAVKGVMVLGTDTNASTSPTLTKGALLSLTNFGADDTIYIDAKYAQAKTVADSTVSFSHAGAAPTTLQFDTETSAYDSVNVNLTFAAPNAAAVANDMASLTTLLGKQPVIVG